MAKRSSRKRGRNTTKKRPELRTGGGRAAKAKRSEERKRSGSVASQAGPVIRMRPTGTKGVLAQHLSAWVFIAVVLLCAWLFGRWLLIGFPDSAWFFLAVGLVSVAPAVGRTSRTVRDADAWGIISLLVPALALGGSRIAGPGCPYMGDCSTIGIDGSLGLIPSFLIVLGSGACGWGLARWQYRSALEHRPSHGRATYGGMLTAMVALMLFPGTLVAATFIALDNFTRDMPSLVVSAADEVERECYGLHSAPTLAVRASPHSYNPDWSTFAVRRANETRPDVGGKKLNIRWATYGKLHPYEATVSFSAGEVVDVTCRRIGPGSGNATKDDLKPTPPDPSSNPMSLKNSPQFLPDFYNQSAPMPEVTTTSDPKGKDAKKSDKDASKKATKKSK